MFHPWTISTLGTSFECKCSIHNTFNSKHIVHMVLTIQIAHIMLFNNPDHEKFIVTLSWLVWCNIFEARRLDKVLDPLFRSFECQCSPCCISLPAVGMLKCFVLNEPKLYFVTLLRSDIVKYFLFETFITYCKLCSRHLSPNFPHILLSQDKHSLLLSWHLCS